MSYLNRRTREYGQPLVDRGRRLRAPVVQTYRGWQPMGDAADDACVAQGEAQAKVFIDALSQMMDAWGNTTGVYAIQDALDVIAKAYAFAGKAITLYQQHRATYGDTGPDWATSGMSSSFALLQTDAATGQEFIRAATSASAAGANLLSAPGLKQWISDLMADASTLAQQVTYITCSEPAGAATIIVILRDLITFGNDILSAIKKAASIAANIVVTTADIVYKTTVGTIDFIGAVVKYLPWIAGGVGALYLWKTYGKGMLGK